MKTMKFIDFSGQTILFVAVLIMAIATGGNDSVEWVLLSSCRSEPGSC